MRGLGALGLRRRERDDPHKAAAARGLRRARRGGRARRLGQHARLRADGRIEARAPTARRSSARSTRPVRSVLVLGAGGAAQAVAAALAHAGAAEVRLALAARDDWPPDGRRDASSSTRRRSRDEVLVAPRAGQAVVDLAYRADARRPRSSRRRGPPARRGRRRPRGARPPGRGVVRALDGRARAARRDARAPSGRSLRAVTLTLVTAGESHGPALVAHRHRAARPGSSSTAAAIDADLRPPPAGLRPQPAPADRDRHGRGARRPPPRPHARHAARARRPQPRPHELDVGDEPVAARGRAGTARARSRSRCRGRATPTSRASLKYGLDDVRNALERASARSRRCSSPRARSRRRSSRARHRGRGEVLGSAARQATTSGRERDRRGARRPRDARRRRRGARDRRAARARLVRDARGAPRRPARRGADGHPGGQGGRDRRGLRAGRAAAAPQAHDEIFPGFRRADEPRRRARGRRHERRGARRPRRDEAAADAHAAAALRRPRRPAEPARRSSSGATSPRSRRSPSSPRPSSRSSSPARRARSSAATRSATFAARRARTSSASRGDRARPPPRPRRLHGRRQDDDRRARSRARLGRPFVDLDEEIEAAVGRRSRVIFDARRGGVPRRSRSAVAPKELRAPEPAVIALGGGAVETSAATRGGSRIAFDRPASTSTSTRRGSASAAATARSRGTRREFRRLYEERRPLYERGRGRARDATPTASCSPRAASTSRSARSSGSASCPGRRPRRARRRPPRRRHLRRRRAARARRPARLGARAAAGRGGEDACRRRAALGRARRSTAAAPSSRSAAAASPTSPASPRPRTSAACLGRRADDARRPGRRGDRRQDRRSTSARARTSSAPSTGRRGRSIDPALLETLPADERRDGMAEVVKTGLLAGEPSSGSCPTPSSSAAAPRSRRPSACATRTTQGERAVLNLGHTFAHALEAAAATRCRTATPSRSACSPRCGSPEHLGLDATGPSGREAARPEAGRASTATAPGQALRRDKKAVDGRVRLVLLEAPAARRHRRAARGRRCARRSTR